MYEPWIESKRKRNAGGRGDGGVLRGEEKWDTYCHGPAAAESRGSRRCYEASAKGDR